MTAYKKMPKQYCIAREGFPFIAAALAGVLVFWAAGFLFIAALFFALAVFIAFFFRNPERVAPAGDGLVVSPADGRVVEIKNTKATYTGEDAVKVGIFMSVMNVHMNRMPVRAKVLGVNYHPGKFLVASLDKASEQNERNGVVLEDEKGRKFVMVQVAGLIARRIVCYLNEGDSKMRGERFGLIRFGSRVDVYLPCDAKVGVAAGDRVRAGESVIGRFE